MPSNRIVLRLIACLAMVWGGLITAPFARAASRERVLHFFNGKDGAYPYDNLILDTAGNLYGTTFGDCNPSCYNGCGTVFKLAPDGNGKWIRTVLHRFHGKDGQWPFAGLIFDAAGNLYGETWVGGRYDYGTVFELIPASNGLWTGKILHSFGGWDGYNPHSSLVFDSRGNLYGTTYGAFGNVFELSPARDGRWIETILHTFNGTDGWVVYAGLILDAEGNLYGATANGGDYGFGTVFELAHGGSSVWTYKLLHSFNGNDGSGPVGTLVFDAAGNLYGTTDEGGNSNCVALGCGVVFRLSHSGTGWSETVLHYFNGVDGAHSNAGVVLDSLGNLYGTTIGDPYGQGTVFKLERGDNDVWTETILHAFSGRDGAYPSASLFFDAAGNLYGTTIVGGNLNACTSDIGDGCGVVFEIAP